MDDNNIYDEITKKIETKYGKGVISNLSNNYSGETISSGSISLDNALGGKGFPKGKIIEIFGNESSGKTTIALQCVAQCQKEKGKVAYIDAENSLDAKYVENIGVNINDLLIAQPDSGEQAFSIINALIKTNKIDLIIVDSVAALVPEQELNGDIYDQNIGAHARLMSKGLRIIQNSLSKTNTTIIFINQLREKVGVVYGNPEITTGGRALKFYSTIRAEARKSELLKDGNEPIGIKSKVTIVKNKISAPLKIAYVDIFFGKGFDYQNEIINFAIDYDIISKKGSWYYLDEEKICQGKSQLNEFVKNNKDIFEVIKTRTLEKIDK